MSNADKNMQFTPTYFQQRNHNDDMFTIHKLAELQSKNVLDLPTLPIAKYLNEIELQISNLSFVFQEVTQNS